MLPQDDVGTTANDPYIWSKIRDNFMPLHMGAASLLVLDGDGTGNGVLGDMASPAAKTIWDSSTVGLWQAHSWWEADLVGVFNWYAMSASAYLSSYPGDVGQPLDFSPNPDFFLGGSDLSSTTDISTWTPKDGVSSLSKLWGDPRNLTQAGNTAVSTQGRTAGQYDNVSLFDLDGPLTSIVPAPYVGADRKDLTSTTGCDRITIGWGPFTMQPGESLTIWQVDLVGAGKDGMYDVLLRAQDVWMQRKYNPANDTFYWDGSNDRILPTYDSGGNVTDSQTVNLGRGAGSGAVFFPPPAPTLSVFPTNAGTIALAWLNNAEGPIDPGVGSPDFSLYLVYRSSSYADQFLGQVDPVTVGYNNSVAPANMGLAVGSTPVTDLTDPTAAIVRTSHPYARFIQPGNSVAADYNIGGVFDFIDSDVNSFSAGAFAGPYIQIGEFSAGGGSRANQFNPPATVDVPNPVMPGTRPPGFLDDNIQLPSTSRHIVDLNASNGAGTAQAVIFPTQQFSGGNIEGLPVDPRIAGKQEYLFEDKTVLTGFNYGYYVAAVDNESSDHGDFDSVLQNPVAPSKTVIARRLDGLESFYTMNANGTDGRWHGTFPLRGTSTGPNVPGQAVVPFLVPEPDPVTTIYVEDAVARPDGQAVVSIVLDNIDPVAGIQISVQPLLDGVPTTGLVADGVINILEDQGFSISEATHESGVTTLLVFILDGGELTPGNHGAADLLFSVEGVAPGTVFDIGAENIILSDPESESLEHEVEVGQVFVGIPGDLSGGETGNGDGQVDVLDVIKTVNYVIGLLPQPTGFERYLADMNGDDAVDVRDIVLMVREILYPGAPKTIAAVNTSPLHLGLGDYVVSPEGRSSFPVTIHSEGNVAGLQVTLMFDPENMVLGTPELTELAGDMSLNSHVAGGSMTVLIYSLNGRTIDSGAGSVLSVPVTARESATVQLMDVVVADVQAAQIPVVLGSSPLATANVPDGFQLMLNRPNPFNPSTAVTYEVPRIAHITITVYNLLGQEIVRLVDAIMAPGRHSVTWNGRNAAGLGVASGVYVYRMTSSTGFSKSRRMNLLK